MVRHVVMWKVKNSENKTSDIQRLKSALEDLEGKIKEIIDWEVAVDFSQKGEASCDIILISSFTSEEDLHTYQIHPDHQKVVELVRTLTVERRLVDYYF